MKIAVFISHPIQYYSPFWREIAQCPGVELTVHYYSKASLRPAFDSGFGRDVKWNIGLLDGYRSNFLPRRWPMMNELDNSWKSLNNGIEEQLDLDVDVAYVSGYIQINNWIVSRLCKSKGIPLMMQSDSNSLVLADTKGPKAWFKEQVVCSFYRSISVFLSMGDKNRDYLMHYGAPKDRIKFCPYPTDTARFRSSIPSDYDKSAIREKYGIPLNAFVVAFSGKMVQRKRPQDLIEAIRMLNRKNIVALMIGSGELEKALGIDPFIRWLGFVNQNEMPIVLSMADVLVLPSSYEPYGQVVPEAQCLGIPVILSDRCGCYGPNSVFRDQESGYLYPCGDVVALSSCIARIMDDPEVRDRMSDRARVLAEENSLFNTAQSFISAAEFAVAHPRF